MNRRVLIIEDDPEYRQLVTSILTAGRNAFEVQTCGTLGGVLDMLIGFSPDVILLDLDLPDSSGYETFLRVRARVGGTPIVILTGHDDDLAAIRSAGDGAQEYLVKCFQQPKLILRCLNMVLRRQVRHLVPKPPKQVLGFIGSKGGVGSSTIAVNVAAHLAQSGRDTLAIEFHPGPGSMAAYLPFRPQNGVNSLFEIPAGRLTRNDIQKTLVEAGHGLRILCPGVSATIATPASAECAEAIVCAAQQMHNCVVLDLPPRIDNGVAAALRLCDSTAVIVDREESSVCSAVEMLEQIKTAGCEESRIRVIAVDRTISEIPLAELFTRLKMYPLFVIPHTASGVSVSYTARTPLVWLSPEERFCVALREMVDRIVCGATQHFAPLPPQPEAAEGDHTKEAFPEGYFG
jgi:DNA-binding response OmpR family regulator